MSLANSNESLSVYLFIVKHSSKGTKILAQLSKTYYYYYYYYYHYCYYYYYHYYYFVNFVHLKIFFFTFFTYLSNFFYPRMNQPDIDISIFHNELTSLSAQLISVIRAKLWKGLTRCENNVF